MALAIDDIYPIIDLGDIYTIVVRLYDEAGDPADTTSVTVVVTPLPDGPAQSPVAMDRVELGLYETDYLPAVTGLHAWSATAEGDIDGVFQDVFTVEDPSTPAMVSLPEIKTYLGMTGSDDDEQLRFLALVASDACESSEGTDRAWRRTAVTERRHGGGQLIRLRRRPVLEVTEVTESGNPLAPGDWLLDEGAGELYRGTTTSSMTWVSGRLNVEIGYVAGAASVPPLVRQGVLEMVQHLYSLPHHGRDAMPRQDGYAWQPTMSFLIPARVATAWRPSRRRPLIA